MKEKFSKLIPLKSLLTILLGCLLFATSFALFLQPNLISTGGVSGLAMAINHMTGFPMGLLIVVMNIPLLAIAFWKFGIRFIASTLFATLLSSVMLDLALSFLPCFTNDLLLASLYGGVMLGAGLALVFIGGATTGGSDILGKLITLRYPHIKLGRIMLIVDALVIVFSAMVFRDINLALYAMITVYVSSVVIDAIIYGADKAVLIYVISNHTESIGADIIAKLQRGVTYLKGVGGHSKSEKGMILCAVRRNETTFFNEIVHNVDPDAFVIMTEAHNVFGLGFSPYNKRP